MANDYDAIIIGAGIIGVCVGFELAKRGHKTLNVDKLPAAGYGSTSNTCAIIRLHYSTPDGVAMARESYFHWLDWGRYLGVADESGLARYVNTGCLVNKNERNKDLVNVMRSLDELHVAYEDLDAAGIDIPATCTGKSLLPVMRSETEAVRTSGNERRRTLRQADRREGSRRRLRPRVWLHQRRPAGVPQRAASV